MSVKIDKIDIMCRKCRATFPNEKWSDHDCIPHLSARISSLEDKVEYLLAKDQPEDK